MIRRIWADNYKSLKSFDLELGQFNVLLGANGAGKSNIIDLLSFIQDSLLMRDGVTSASAIREGWLGVNAAKDQVITIGFDLDLDFDIIRENVLYGGLGELGLAGIGLNYELFLQWNGDGYSVAQEILGRRDPGSVEWNEMVLKRDSDGLLLTSGFDGSAATRRTVADMLPEQRLALGYPVNPLITIAKLIEGWQFLDINPLHARGSTPDVGSKTLARDASNLASLLYHLTPVEHDLVRDAMRRDVPGFDDFSARPFSGLLFYSVKESSVDNLPPSSVSDGTIRLLALYSVYYGAPWVSLICIEEPENGLHPELLETIVEYLRSMSERTQVIVTTHSPLLLDWCHPDEVILLDKQGGSTRAMRVDERSQIKEFLKDWTLGDLWTRDLLPVREVSSGTSVGGAG